MTTIRMDTAELVEGIPQVEGCIKVVVTHQHLETGTGILEIFVLEIFEVAGISSSRLGYNCHHERD